MKWFKLWSEITDYTIEMVFFIYYELFLYTKSNEYNKNRIWWSDLRHNQYWINVYVVPFCKFAFFRFWNWIKCWIISLYIVNIKIIIEIIIKILRCIPEYIYEGALEHVIIYLLNCQHSNIQINTRECSLK